MGQARGKSLPPARQAAIDIIRAAMEGTDLQAALDTALSGRAHRPLDPRDAALATQLSYGYLRHKGRVDHVVETFLSAPDKIPDRMRLALGVAAYELLFMDKVPAYASVDWAVDYAKASSPGLARLANAVLRKVDAVRAKAGSEEFYGRDTADPATVLARFYSCPPWMASLWLRAYGEDNARRLMAATTQVPPLGLRVNDRKAGARDLFDTLAGVPGCVLADYPTLAFTAGAGPSELAELLDTGRVSRQSAASQQALQGLLPPGLATPVWDACAGRGGKTTLLLERGLGPVLASDPSLSRLRGLQAELRRLDLDGCLVFRAVADKPAPLARPVPAILLDVPCSGLGVASRRPDLKWKRREADLAGLVRLQAAILDQAHASLAPGGHILYLTCTLNPAENQDQTAAFLKRHPDMRLTRTRSPDLSSPLAEFFWGAVLQKR